MISAMLARTVSGRRWLVRFGSAFGASALASLVIDGRVELVYGIPVLMGFLISDMLNKERRVGTHRG
jgi:hypothetical protein